MEPEKKSPPSAEPPAPAPAAGHTTARVIGLVLFLAAGLAGLYLFGLYPKQAQDAKLEARSHADKTTPPLVVYTHPFIGPRFTSLILPGDTKGYYETTLYAQVSGYLASWKVDYGDRVKKDQLLAIVDTPELDEQLMQARAELEVTKADSVLSKAKLDFAKVSFDRWEAAAPSGAVSKEERDSKKADFDTSKAAYQASLARVDLADANVKRLEYAKGFSKVLAPFSGVITNRSVDIGSLITAGSTAGNTSMFSLSQQDTLRTFVKVPQSAMTDIRIGQEADILAKEFPGRVFTGKVDRTANAIDPVSRTLLTEVLVPNPDLVLYSGMYVQVRFVLTHDPPRLLIPANALLLRSVGPQVAVLDANNRVRFKDIKISRDYGDKVEIAEGLKGDEHLAVNLNIQIREGDLITPQEMPGPTTASRPTTASQPAERQ